MGKSSIDAKRGNIFRLEPERLTLVTDKNHPLYDPRVEDEPSESMIANIAMHGVLEPIIVRKNGEVIEVVAGRGRTKATLEANRRLAAEGKPPLLIPAIVRGGSDADLFGVLIAENEIRREDTMIHKGEKARKLLNMGYSVQQIAVTFGVTRQAVEKWLEADELPQQIKDAVKNGEISATAAVQMSGYSREEQVQRYEDIKQRGEKPTVRNMKSAAASPVNRCTPRMQTRPDIEKELLIGHPDHEDYWRGFNDALRWVLGEYKPGRQ
ncbi:MAG: ParB N-terminal domain-containing protein [Puniceicoccales bacterium]|jgi:ParB family chromosome partitioning protein|nr:ParB N-terminal domain-containing protein [Puniceicoccales bacterium]